MYINSAAIHILFLTQITDISNLKCGLRHVLKSMPWTSSPSFAWVFDRGPISAISEVQNAEKYSISLLQPTTK
jgi:hypothetical protein